MTNEEERNLFKDVLLLIHLCRWTGNNEKLMKLLDIVGDYSYSCTNSSGDWEDDVKNQIHNLNRLSEFIYGTKNEV